MLWPPLVFATLAAGFVFYQAKRIKKMGIVTFIVGYIAYLAGAFLGEILNHKLYAANFRQAGDSPAQIFYLIIVWLLSIFFVPFVYALAKKEKRSRPSQQE
jgi:MFS family permease